MAEFVRIPVALVESVYEIPETVSYDEAAYAETLACTLQAIDLADVRATDCVVIIGCGGVGLTFVQLATARQASRVIVADRKDDALEQATALGAWRTVNVARESLAEVVAAETGGYGADVVVEAVGASETYEQALTLLRCGGRVVGFGGAHPGSEFRCDPNLIHYRSLKLFGAYRYAPDHYLRALGMIRAREVDLRPVLTHHVPFSRLTRDAVSIHSEPACRALIIDINEDT